MENKNRIFMQLNLTLVVLLLFLIRTMTEKVRATMLRGHSGQKQDRMARNR